MPGTCTRSATDDRRRSAYGRALGESATVTVPVDDIEALPPHLRRLSAMDREIALPLAAALEAIDFFERHGWDALGWEGVVRRRDGAMGHPPKALGTAGMPIDRAEAYEFMRSSLADEAREWGRDPIVRDAELLFCLTFEPPPDAQAD
jgi:hypothetical protein